MSATTAREPCLSEVMTAMGFWDVIEVDALPCVCESARGAPKAYRVFYLVNEKPMEVT